VSGKAGTGGAVPPAAGPKPRNAPVTAWRVDLKGLKSRESMLKAVAASLEFPAHFGVNLDALYDCLTDLPLAPGVPYVIELANLARAAPGDALHTVFADAALYWRDKGVSLAIRRN
jgi:RNAse (barnase) inhibitor barstar